MSNQHDELIYNIEKLFSFRRSERIIPEFQVSTYSGWSNQPSNDDVEVVSNNAADTMKCTILGTVHGTGAYRAVTIQLAGTTPVETGLTDWGTITGIILGEQDGKSITAATGTVTLRKKTGAATITTIAAGKVSTGRIEFNLVNKDIILIARAGTVWKNAKSFSTTSSGLPISAGQVKAENIESRLSLISDSTGGSAAIEILEN